MTFLSFVTTPYESTVDGASELADEVESTVDATSELADEVESTEIGRAHV